MFLSLVRRLPALSRSKKRSILIIYDLLAMVVALWAAFSTRLGIFYVPYSRSVLLSAAVSFAVGLAALYRLHKLGHYDAGFVAEAIKDLGVNPEKIDPYFA